jgi:hypothetical protein
MAKKLTLEKMQEMARLRYPCRSKCAATIQRINALRANYILRLKSEQNKKK